MDFSGTEIGTNRSVNASFAALLTFNDNDMVENIEVRGDTALLKSDYPAVEPVDLDPNRIRQMAENYKNAWCTGDPKQVASFYAEDGFIIINGGLPWAGRAGLAAMSGGFIDAYPDAILTTDDLHIEADRAVWSWTFSGTNTGPGGNGNKAVFSGYEVWRINDSYQIAESYGYYDSAI